METLEALVAETPSSLEGIATLPKEGGSAQSMETIGYTFRDFRDTPLTRAKAFRKRMTKALISNTR